MLGHAVQVCRFGEGQAIARPSGAGGVIFEQAP
jgi:hypothetical protein